MFPTYSPHTDTELFRLIANGDESAFREVFYRFGPVLHPFVLDIVKTDAVAREIVQETFLRLWLKRETLEEIEKPSSWLYRVASNLSLTHFRRQHLEAKVLQAIHDRPGLPIDNDSEPLRLKELQNLIHQAANHLSPQRKKIFDLSRQQGLSRKEVAARLGLSENTIKNQLAIALKSIQDFIQQHSGAYIPFLLILPLLPPH